MSIGYTKCQAGSGWTAYQAPRYDVRSMSVHFSQFASSVGVETAFSVLAIAKRLMAAGKDVIELEIGDSPFRHAAEGDRGGRAGDPRWPQPLRSVARHHGFPQGGGRIRATANTGCRVTGDHVVAGPGAKNFEQLFCEAFLNPGDGVLVFSPHFPTYPPNIFRRNARVVLSELKASNDFRPNIDDVRRFLRPTSRRGRSF